MSESKEEKNNEKEKSLYQLEPCATISTRCEVFSIRFSPDGKFIAAGGDDGSVKLFHSTSGDRVGNGELDEGSTTSTPTTCIRFRPNTSFHRTKDVFVTANSCGMVRHWQLQSKKCFHTYTDKAEQVFALDYNDMGTKFVTAGRDGALRVYDEESKQMMLKLEGGLLGDYDREAPGHSNRVFSVKFTHDENILISSGWDNTVQIWDIREECPVRSLHGMHICGDALDIRHGEILTGSFRPTNQLELWDFGSGERITEVPWLSADEEQPEKSCSVYAAQFSKDSIGRFIAAGGTGKNEARVFDHRAGNTLIGTVEDFGDGVYTVDFSPDGDLVAFGSADRTIRIYNLAKTREYFY